MIIKILMVAIFILLSWNTFQLSKSNDFLRSEFKAVVDKVQSNKDDLSENKSTLAEQSKTLLEQIKILQEQSMSLQEQSKSLAAHSKQSKSNQETLKKLIEKDSKKNVSAEKQNKTLNYLKSTLEKMNTKLAENTKLAKENKNNIIEIKKTSYRISDKIKKHSNDYANHYRKPTHHNYVKGKVEQKKVEKKKVVSKPIIKKDTEHKDLNPFYKMAVALHKTKEFYKNKKMDKASEQLLKLKAEVWKSRKIENSPTKLVMSILSSIDITNKKWTNKEHNHNLNKVEEKINQLFFKLGVTK